MTGRTDPLEVLSRTKVSPNLPHIPLTERRLLKRVKRLCKECEFDNPNQYKLHTFRHHFASMCSNHGVAHRKALAWLELLKTKNETE